MDDHMRNEIVIAATTLRPAITTVKPVPRSSTPAPQRLEDAPVNEVPACNNKRLFPPRTSEPKLSNYVDPLQRLAATMYSMEPMSKKTN